MANSRISVVVADDHPLYREGVARAIKERPEFRLLATCETAQDALLRTREFAPDVALLDLKLPDLPATRVVEAIERDALPTRVLLLSAFTESALVYEALEAGASGYISKDAGRREICEAISRIASGGTVLSSGLQHGIAAQIRAHRQRARPSLTNRERDVLHMIAQGFSAPEIGRRLFVSATTVKTHQQHVYEKLGVSERAAAVAVAMRHGLLD
jgi:two-component system nitrate/nitrite response regulator NarL